MAKFDYKEKVPTTGKVWLPNNDVADLVTINKAVRTEEFTTLGQGLRILAAITVDSDIAIESGVSINQRVIRLTFSPGVVPTTDHHIMMKELVALYQSKIVSVANVTGDTYDVTLAQPFDYGFGSLAIFGVETHVELQNTNLAIAATAANPTIASVNTLGLLPGVKYNLYGASVLIVDNAAMDDSLFGGIPALTYGIMVRVELAGVLIKNTSIYRNNGDFFVAGFMKSYATKAPSGSYALNARMEFIPVSGTIVPLRHSDNPMDYDKFDVYLQDDVSAIDTINVMYNGNITLDDSFYYG